MSDYKMSLEDFCYYVARTAYTKVKEAEIPQKMKETEQKIQENETVQKVATEVKSQMEKIGQKAKDAKVKERASQTVDSVSEKLNVLKQAGQDMSKEEKIAAVESKYKELSKEVEELWTEYMGSDGKIRKGAESAVEYVRVQLRKDGSVVDVEAEEVEEAQTELEETKEEELSPEEEEKRKNRPDAWSEMVKRCQQTVTGYEDEIKDASDKAEAEAEARKEMETMPVIEVVPEEVAESEEEAASDGQEDEIVVEAVEEVETTQVNEEE